MKRSITASGNRVSVSGSLSLSDVEALREAFDHLLDDEPSEVVVDVSGMAASPLCVQAALFGGMRRLRESGIGVRLSGASDDLQDRLRKLESFLTGKRKQKVIDRTRAYFEDIGDSAVASVRTLEGLLRFWRESLLSFLRVAFGPGKLKWREAFYYMEQAGVKAVPIIVVLCWLLGVVLGYMSAYQLKDFGAETFMPDLVGLSMIWEIAPLLAAVLVAGRSGSAFAAELGTMKVRQEVDALAVMGFDVPGYLVVPKMVALLFVMPFLTLLANLFGLLGGMLVGGWYLGMPVEIFLSRLEFVLIPLDFYWGMVKSLVYALIVSTVGCFMGIRVRGGAAEVGRSTTSAVVASIFLVILADAMIAIVFMHIRPGISI